MPSQKGEPESCKTSQLCAMICIQVPMAEVHAPIHMMRKSRYWKALKTRVSNRDSDQGSGRSRWIRWRIFPSMSLKNTRRCL